MESRAAVQAPLTKNDPAGYAGFPQDLQYDVTFTVPPGEPHRFGQFEALTGYMPPEFSEFYTIREGGRREPLSDGPGEQTQPVLFSTKDGRFAMAMGIYSPDQPARGFESLGYGRFRFAREAVVKWNCVFRVKVPQGLPAGDYHFRLRVPVGTRDDVTRDLARLRQTQR